MVITNNKDHIAVTEIGDIITEVDNYLSTNEHPSVLDTLIKIKRLDLIGGKVLSLIPIPENVQLLVILCLEHRIRIQTVILPDGQLSYNVKKY